MFVRSMQIFEACLDGMLWQLNLLAFGVALTVKAGIRGIPSVQLQEKTAPDFHIYHGLTI